MKALLIGAAPESESESEPEAEASREDSGEGPGPLACRAYRKAMQAGDDAAAFEAFKDILMAADDDLSVDEPDADDKPGM